MADLTTPPSAPVHEAVVSARGDVSSAASWVAAARRSRALTSKDADRLLEVADALDKAWTWLNWVVGSTSNAPTPESAS